MKRLFVILLVLCAWVANPMLHAQVYTTSSANYHSVSSGGMVSLPEASSFRSTSAYAMRKSGYTVTSKTYSTAPMCMATGTISTVASQLAGGVLAEESYGPNNDLRGPRRGPGSGGIAPPDTPIGDGWDVALLLALLCLAYGIYLRRNAKRQAVK